MVSTSRIKNLISQKFLSKVDEKWVFEFLSSDEKIIQTLKFMKFFELKNTTKTNHIVPVRYFARWDKDRKKWMKKRERKIFDGEKHTRLQDYMSVKHGFSDDMEKIFTNFINNNKISNTEIIDFLEPLDNILDADDALRFFSSLHIRNTNEKYKLDSTPYQFLYTNENLAKKDKIEECTRDFFVNTQKYPSEYLNHFIFFNAKKYLHLVTKNSKNNLEKCISIYNNTNETFIKIFLLNLIINYIMSEVNIFINERARSSFFKKISKPIEIIDERLTGEIVSKILFQIIDKDGYLTFMEKFGNNLFYILKSDMYESLKSEKIEQYEISPLCFSVIDIYMISLIQKFADENIDLDFVTLFLPIEKVREMPLINLDVVYSPNNFIKNCVKELHTSFIHSICRIKKEKIKEEDVVLHKMRKIFLIECCKQIFGFNNKSTRLDYIQYSPNLCIMRGSRLILTHFVILYLTNPQEVYNAIEDFIKKDECVGNYKYFSPTFSYKKNTTINGDQKN